MRININEKIKKERKKKEKRIDIKIEKKKFEYFEKKNLLHRYAYVHMYIEIRILQKSNGIIYPRQ